MSAYYNEIDAEKAECIRELIKWNVVAPGEVDERSIADVRADELCGYTQCHFFAGFGCWSYALRLARWQDDKPVWTGSCPCPSFSAAGKGHGFADPRHLWPSWFRLIRECRPPVLLGEQVGAAIGHGWLDLVHSDLEGEAYAVAAAVLGAASAGAPHIRQRLYFCADTEHDGHDPAHRVATVADSHQPRVGLFNRDGDLGKCADTDGGQSEDRDLQRGGEQRLLAPDRGTGDGSDTGHRMQCQRARPSRQQHEAGASIGSELRSAGEARSGDNSERARLEGHGGDVREWRGPGWLDPLTARSVAEAGATGGFWGDCDWWWGRDSKWRPIGPGISPLISGAAKSRLLQMVDGPAADLRLVRDFGEAEPESAEARVLRLKGYGDAICVETARAFIESYCEAREGRVKE